MKKHHSWQLLFLLTGLSACGANHATSGMKDLSDATAIFRRNDGKFDVTCRNGRLEVATEEQVKKGEVCLPPTPTPLPEPRFVTGNERHWIMSTQASENGTQWQREIIGLDQWRGYVSFSVTVERTKTRRADIQLVIKDGKGWSWRYTSEDGPDGGWGNNRTTQYFEKLTLPVTIFERGGRGLPDTQTDEIKVDVSPLQYELTSANPILPPITLFRSAASYDVKLTDSSLYRPYFNHNVSFSVTAQFFKNYHNGNACSRMKATVAGNVTYLTPQNPSFSVKDTKLRDIVFTPSPTCASSLLPPEEMENKDHHFALHVSETQIGDPF